jgi:hypothetical protein
MPLTQDSENAFRQCLRLLAPLRNPQQRQQMARNVEQYIAEGRWIPTFTLEEVALLFYPGDSELCESLLLDMRAAEKREELCSSIRNERSKFRPNDFALWPECPPVPAHSPLRYWLPAFMHDTDEKAPTKGAALAVDWRTQIRDAATEWARERRVSGKKTSKVAAAREMEVWCRNHDVNAERGQPPKYDYIKRHILNSWTPPS